MGKKLSRILPKVATSTAILGYFTCRKFTTSDRRLYFPSEGRGAEDFFARTWVPKASTLTNRPSKPLFFIYCSILMYSAHRLQAVDLRSDTKTNFVNKNQNRLHQRFSTFFQVGTTFISQNVLRTTLLLALSNSLGLP